MNWIERITPGFLKRLDHYLLVHRPLIWRTKIHFIGFWSLIVTNVLIFGISKLAPVSPSSFPTDQVIWNWQVIFWVMIGFAGLFWGLQSIKFPLRNPDLKGISLTVFLVIFGFSSLIFNQVHLTHQLKLMGARAISTEALEADYEAYLEIKRIVRVGTIENPVDLSEEKALMLPILKKYGLSDWHILENSQRPGLYDDEQVYHEDAESHNNLTSRYLENTFKNIVEAKYYHFKWFSHTFFDISVFQSSDEFFGNGKLYNSNYYGYVHDGIANLQASFVVSLGMSTLFLLFLMGSVKWALLGLGANFLLVLFSGMLANFSFFEFEFSPLLFSSIFAGIIGLTWRRKNISITTFYFLIPILPFIPFSLFRFLRIDTDYSIYWPGIWIIFFILTVVSLRLYSKLKTTPQK